MSPAALDLACAIARARIASACTSLQRANAFTRTLKDHP